MFSTIQNLTHYIPRIIYGNSELSFGEDIWVMHIQGVGQGNGAGPQNWAAVSTPILNMLRKEGYGVFFKCALSSDTLQFVGYPFVDDVDLCVSSDEELQMFSAKCRPP
jgi:hypothetical protein